MFGQIKKNPGAAALIVIIFFIVMILFPEMQKRPVQFFARPLVLLISEIQKGFTAVGRAVAGSWEGYVDLWGVREENDRLREEVTVLRNETVRLQEAALAGQRLRELLEFKRGFPHGVAAANIIGRDPSNWYHTLLIDKGEKDGVSIEMGVITPRGVVGRVVKTAPTLSQVLLLTDRNSAVAALIQQTRDEGLVEGTEMGLARIKYLSLQSPAREGDLVLTSGLTGIFPKGIMIGTLGPLVKKEGALFQEAQVIPSVDFSKLEEVLVITSLSKAGLKP